MNMFEFKRWDTEAKIRYRGQVIVSQYRRIYQRESIPDNRQYITLAGNHVADGKRMEMSELGQLSKYSGLDDRPKLISEGQFIGIDREKAIIDRNRQKWPRATWICGDFVKVINGEIGSDGDRIKKFNPAIIHVDMVNMHVNALEIAQNVIHRVEEFCRPPVMVVFNVVARRRMDTKAQDYEFARELWASPRNGRWDITKELYKYGGGADNSKTEMVATTMNFWGR